MRSFRSCPNSRRSIPRYLLLSYRPMLPSEHEVRYLTSLSFRCRRTLPPQFPLLVQRYSLRRPHVPMIRLPLLIRHSRCDLRLRPRCHRSTTVGTVGPKHAILQVHPTHSKLALETLDTPAAPLSWSIAGSNRVVIRTRAANIFKHGSPRYADAL